MRDRIKNILKWMKDYVLITMVLVLSFFLLTTRECNNSCTDNIIYDTITHYDTTWTFVKVTPIIKDTIYHSIPSNINEKEIIKEYYTEYIYDTVIVDTFITYKLKWSNFNNKTNLLNIDYKFTKPTMYVTPTIVEKKCIKIYAGIGIGNSWNSIDPMLSGNLLLQTKRDNIYGLRIDPIMQTVEGSMYWKIKLKK